MRCDADNDSRRQTQSDLRCHESLRVWPKFRPVTKVCTYPFVISHHVFKLFFHEPKIFSCELKRFPGTSTCRRSPSRRGLLVQSEWWWPRSNVTSVRPPGLAQPLLSPTPSSLPPWDLLGIGGSILRFASSRARSCSPRMFESSLERSFIILESVGGLGFVGPAASVET